MNRVFPISAIVLLGTLTAAAAEDASKLADLPKLTVRGDAELEKPADQVRLRVSVVTDATDAEEALGANSRRMRDVTQAIEKTGLTEKEYKTGRFTLQPQYSRRLRTDDADWRPEIVGYQVTNTLAITTKKLDLTGELIQAANEAGANSIDSIVFDLADARMHRAEAISAATANARGDALVLADAARIDLIQILSITLDEGGHRPILRATLRRPEMASAVAPPIRPGDVTVRAAVTIVWEIHGRP